MCIVCDMNEGDNRFNSDTESYEDLLNNQYQSGIAPSEIQAFGDLPTDALDWGTQVAGSAVINVFFAGNGTTVTNYANQVVTSDGWSAYAKAQFLDVFDKISSVVDITFNVVTNQASADFQLATDDFGAFPNNYTLGYMGPPNYGFTSGVGVFNNTSIVWSDSAGGAMDEGGVLYATMLHEIGHGLGMAHAHDDGGTSVVMDGVTSTFGDYGDYNLNQEIFTVMSYNSGWELSPNGTPNNYNYGNMASYGALDIALLQSKYGANTTYASSADTYTLGVDNFYSAIWDTGGTDTIRYNGTADAIIDLREATLQYESGGGGYVSYIDGYIGGFTIANGVVIERGYGGSGDDIIVGNTANNLLIGGGGADTLYGRNGNDELQGGLDADVLYGDAGDDSLYGNAGDDTIRGGTGADYIEGGEGADDIIGENGNDVMLGGDDGDTILGADGNDFIRGDNGNDRLEGGAGYDKIIGGEGNDAIFGGANNDQLYGNNGNDALTGDGGNDVMYGGSGKDRLWGGDGYDTLNGDNDTDYLWGGNNPDRLFGGRGNDYMYGEASDDYMSGGVGDDYMEGGAGRDKMLGGENRDVMLGGDGNDIMYGNESDDFMRGDDGNDYMNGGSGNDRMIGGAGADTLFGDTGADTMYGGTGNDIFVFNSVNDSGVSTGRDTIADFASGDQIDLAFLGTVNFINTAGFSNVAGQVREYTSGSNTILAIDSNGDGVADMEIAVADNFNFTSGDFI